MPLFKCAAAQLSTLVFTVSLATTLAMLSQHACALENTAAQQAFEETMPARTSEATAQSSADLIFKALALLGVPYKYGGNSPEKGFDCSGLVGHVFAAALGITLPRRAEQISRLGQGIAKEELKPGDLVFFNTLKRTFSHVGIYLGGQRFIHAPSRGGEVRIDNLNEAYWFKRFNGARRIEADSSVPNVAEPRPFSTPLLLESTQTLQAP